VAVRDIPDDWNAKTIDVGGATRDWFVFLPPGYDPMKPYPVVYQFHGCSPDKESNNVPIENESKDSAIIVRGRAVADCWDTTGEGPDVKFFDAMMDAVEAGYCADVDRRFVAGYSSGSFMTHLLGCSRGALLTGVASIAGGQTGQGCTGPVAALLIHDSDDQTVNISASIGARDQYLAANHCASTTQPFDPDPCQQYDGCDAGFPVVWCQTAGHGHDRQDALAAPAFWNFFKAL
jgi:poly(3-hydroxybutyrate) depolymerase